MLFWPLWKEDEDDHLDAVRMREDEEIEMMLALLPTHKAR